MRGPLAVVFGAVLASVVPQGQAQTKDVRTSYQVRQLAAGAVYLDGGSDAGLKEGMHLKVFRLTPGEAQMSRKEIGDITIIAVATISAVCEVKEGSKPIEVGDTAELTYEDAQAIELVRTSKTLRHVAQTVAFTEGDPIEEELREYVPHRPSPAVNRIRGRISFQQGTIFDHTTGMRSLQEGLVVRMDMTRIAGTYWNFTGYWNGRMTSQSTTVQTLNDLLNRTYTIGFYYNNPNSHYVGGFGRFLLPWAPSLNTMDGGYFGRRLGAGFTAGIFAGSTPDPLAWNYNPNRQQGGTFIAFERGSYDRVRYASTVGVAMSRSHWHPERQFLFSENSFSVGTHLFISHSAEVDKVTKSLTSNGINTPQLARSFATLRIQPIRRISLDVGHNYFRTVPTFDLRLLGTGLLDQFLFQGFSGGFRAEIIRGIQLSGNFGQSKGTQDSRPSLNYAGGLSFPRLPRLPVAIFLPRVPKFSRFVPGLPRVAAARWLPGLGFRTDLRYSKFTSSFATGSYGSLMLTRQFTEKLHLDMQVGEQRIASTFTPQTRTRFATSNLDYLIGRHYILGAGWTVYHGGTQNYDQTFVTLGFRF
jgi:hypothetical protein